jgi:O-antigen/teichoic acid export membrane protein
VSSVPAQARPGIATHYLRYLSSNVLVVAAGFVSFPIMARLLDNRQFGLLGYYEACLLLMAGVLKLGTQHAILRFYPHTGVAGDLSRFRSDHVLAPFGLSLLLWLVCVLAACLFIDRVPSGERAIVAVLLVTVPLVIWCSLIEAVMYALERSDITVWLKTAWRWGELALVLATLVVLERSAFGVLGAKLVVVIGVAMWLTWWFLRWSRAPLVKPARAPLIAGLAFGVPMMFNELTSVLFGFADRLMLRGLTGSLHDVGVYTIGQGLAIAVGTILGATLSQTFTPTAVRLYESRGADAVRELKRSMLDVWLVAVSVGSALLLCTGQDFMILMAGADKAASGPVFVTVAISMLWYSLFEIAQYGMLLQRRAARHFLITLVATLLKLALNVPLILRYGVAGAAAATAIGYLVLAALQYRQCPPELRYFPPLRRLPVVIGFPLAIFGLLHAVDYFGAATPLWRFVVGGVAVMLPALLMAASDRRLRHAVQGLARQRRERMAAM